MAEVEDVIFAMRPDLVDRSRVASGHVMIPCPYHGGGAERTPSCSISREAPVFFCHGCKAGGHVRKLFRDLGCDSDLLLDARMSMLSYDESGYVASGSATVYYAKGRQINPFRGDYLLDEDVLDPYREVPKELKREGFKHETLYHFEVGWDPRNMRITFPLRNIYGELVGISGRTMVNAPEKYRVYTEELTMRADVKVPKDYSIEGVKKALMWNGHSVYGPLWDANEPLVITEGFKACMWVWQSGYQNVVALIGSYLSPAHSELIARATDKAILFLDNNEAGIVGTRKASRELAKRGVVNVTVARYPDEREQPDNLEPEEVLAALRNPMRFSAWRANS